MPARACFSAEIQRRDRGVGRPRSIPKLSCKGGVCVKPSAPGQSVHDVSIRPLARGKPAYGAKIRQSFPDGDIGARQRVPCYAAADTSVLSRGPSGPSTLPSSSSAIVRRCFSHRAAGCPVQAKPRVGTGMRCGRGPCEIFEGTPSCSVSIIRPRRCLPEAHRAQPSPTPDARSGKTRSARTPTRSRCGSCEGTVHTIAHQVEPKGGLRGARETMEHPDKMRMAPCRASIRLPFPTSPERLRAPRHSRRVGHRVARPELATFPAMRGVQPNPR